MYSRITGHGSRIQGKQKLYEKQMSGYEDSDWGENWFVSIFSGVRSQASQECGEMLENVAIEWVQKKGPLLDLVTVTETAVTSGMEL